MTPKQQAFVEHYAACGNATEAAKEAGYSKPNQQGPRLLVNVGIQAALTALTDKASSARIADAKERQEFWTAVMRAEAAQQFAEAELKDRLKASELLGKAQLDFIEKVEMKVGPLEPNWEKLIGQTPST